MHYSIAVAVPAPEPSPYLDCNPLFMGHTDWKTFQILESEKLPFSLQSLSTSTFERFSNLGIFYKKWGYGGGAKISCIAKI